MPLGQLLLRPKQTAVPELGLPEPTSEEQDLTLTERYTWEPLVRLAVAGGLRDRNQLANLVFFARHPERQGRKLLPDEPDYRSLSREWLQIRDTIVDPVLGPTGPTPPTSTGPPAAGPLAAVATPLPWGERPSRRYGIPEVIDALTWIKQEWARRQPEVRFDVHDISKHGGGKIEPHKSHRLGLDADVTLIVDGKRINAKGTGYERHRPFVKELVDVIRANKILPIKTIGFLDRQIKEVAPWKGHIRHLHIRFCRPPKYTTELDLDRVYDAGEFKPSYDCAADGAATSEEDEGLLDLHYEEDSAAEEDLAPSPDVPDCAQCGGQFECICSAGTPLKTPAPASVDLVGAEALEDKADIDTLDVLAPYTEGGSVPEGLEDFIGPGEAEMWGEGVSMSLPAVRTHGPKCAGQNGFESLPSCHPMSERHLRLRLLCPGRRLSNASSGRSIWAPGTWTC